MRVLGAAVIILTMATIFTMYIWIAEMNGIGIIGR